MGWATQGVITDPEVNMILADTGAVAIAATLSPSIVISSQYARRVTMALRDIQNVTDIATQRLDVGSDSPVMIGGITGVSIGLNQRIVLRTENAVVGDVQASIIW